MVQVLAYVGGSSKNPYFASASSNPLAQAAAQGTLQVGPTTNYGPAVVISYGGTSATLAPSSYSALGAGAGVITAEVAYLQANSDVATQIGSRFQTGLQHYLLFGASEGRFYAGVGSQTFTAEQLYLEENADVANAVRAGDYRSGLEHYLTYGAREGRFYYGQSGSSLSAEELYLQENPDVRAGLGRGFYSSGLDHFYKYGQAEGRFYVGLSHGPARDVYVPTVQATQNGTTVNLTPDQQYLLSNPAAAQAVASGRYPDGLRYFLNEGYSAGNYQTLQGWTLSGQNGSAERAYLIANPDIANAVASGAIGSGQAHFFSYGKNESFRTGFGKLTYAAYNAATAEGGYLRANQDAALAVANGVYATGLDYFLNVGATRGQSFGAITAATLGNNAGERAYLSQNRDVASAVANGQYSSGLQHFLDVGYREGRNFGNLAGTSLTSGPTPGLDLAYLRANPDAANAVANGQFGAAFDYFVYLGADRGQQYGRLTAATLGDSNERNYLLRNKDVAAAVATGAEANGLEHFLRVGSREAGRGDYGLLRASLFSDPSLGATELAYLQQNRDVARAVAAGTYSSGLSHFLTVGASEGRRFGTLTAQQVNAATPDGQYLVTHADAAAAIAKGEASSGLDYFLKSGIDKGQSYGRLSAATLGGANDPERLYLTRFQDVALSVATGAQASGLAHYLSYGYKDRLGINYGGLTAEMLIPNFLEGQYLQSTLAAANAVARGQAVNGVDYFLKAGVDQGDSYGKLTAAKLSALGGAERAYLSQNLDVARNVAGANGYESGLLHYLTSGYVEPRRAGYGALNPQTYKPGTAEFKYLLANPDAAQAVANGAAGSGFEYFVTTGAAKGQSYATLTSAAFQANGAVDRDYLLQNRDVANAVGLGVYSSGLDHFLKIGRTEGRAYGRLRAEGLQGTVSNNSELAYLTQHRDVAKAVAEGTYASGLAHYFEVGRSEGRTGYGNVSTEVLTATGLEGDYLRGNAAALQAVAAGTAKSGLEYFLKTGVDKGETYGAITAASLAAVGPAERTFLTRNLDVAAAVAAGTVVSGFEHYVTGGGYLQAWRGQYGNLRSDFYGKDDLQGAYLRANKDAAKAVADGSAVNGLDYFLRVGADKEQTYGTLTAAKLGPVGGAERDYLVKYQNVAAQVAAGSFASGLDHYLRSGYVNTAIAGYGKLTTQGASPSFVFSSVDGKYLRANLDAAKAVANGTAASGHAYFFTTGITKGQSYGTLNNATVGKEGPEFEYLKAHADVAQLVASGQAKSGLIYFLSTGADQGHAYGKIAAGKAGAKTDPERKYLTKYLDVAAAVAAGYFGSGLVHYITMGKAEGRIYEGAANAGLQTITLDPNSRDSWYLVSNEAAFLAVAKGEAKSGLDYFLKVGIDKGDTYGLLNRERFGDASSLERQYLARNLDVAAAVAEGVYFNGLAHYLDVGRTQAWRGSFGLLDPNKLGGSALGDVERKYLQANLDVGQAIADGRYQGDGLQHYLEWGYQQAWRGSYGGLRDNVELKSFNATEEANYLLSNRDVAQNLSISGSVKSGLEHFLKYGDNRSSGYGLVTINDRNQLDESTIIFLQSTPTLFKLLSSSSTPAKEEGAGIVETIRNEISSFLSDIKNEVSSVFSDIRDGVTQTAAVVKDSLRDRTYDTAREYGITGAKAGGIDAFRHVYSHAALALAIGGNLAILESLRAEESSAKTFNSKSYTTHQKGYLAEQMAMDYYNNNLGVKIGLAIAADESFSTSTRLSALDSLFGTAMPKEIVEPAVSAVKSASAITSVHDPRVRETMEFISKDPEMQQNYPNMVSQAKEYMEQMYASDRIKETYGPNYQENYPGYGGKDEGTRASDAIGARSGSNSSSGTGNQNGAGSGGGSSSADGSGGLNPDRGL